MEKIYSINSNTRKKINNGTWGKSPFIVFEDADLDSAVEGVVDAIWFNQGKCVVLAHAISSRKCGKNIY